MKVLGLALLLFTLGGCGTYQSLEDLEQQAFATGDWSEVEKRERIMAKRRIRSGSMCGSGTTQFCESWGGTTRCSCVQADALTGF